jgi:hypothetical protein
MYDTCPTVRVKAENDDGFMVINEADFDEAVHVAFDEPSSEAVEADKAEKADLIAQIVARGGEKPHHATGITKLQEILAAVPPAA